MIGAAIVCQPHIITKSLLLKTDSDVNKYLTVGIITEIIFFLVVITGLYARIVFPDLTVGGEALKLDGIISAYVVSEFPVFIGLIVVMGLISAGISTLEGLIQALASTITADIIQPLFGKHIKGEEETRERKTIAINKIVIAVLGVLAILISYDQLLNPKLSVGIFAQNGVYAYFSAAFVPILFGMFFKDVKKIVPIAASITAVAVHFIMYYGQVRVPFTISTGENPGVAAAVAIVCSIIVGSVLYLATREKSNV